MTVPTLRNSSQQGHLIEVKENYTETSGVQDSPHIDDLSIPQIKLLHANGSESWEQIPPLIENGFVENEVSLNLRPRLIDRLRDHEMDTEEMNYCEESTNIQSVGLETTILDGASETNFTSDPVNDCITCSISNTYTKENIQSHKILPRSTPACMMEREILAEEGIDINNQGDALISDLVSSIEESAEADGNEEIKKVRYSCHLERVYTLLAFKIAHVLKQGH